MTRPVTSAGRPAAVIILAAGEGTRMRSATPKVLHRLGGRSLLAHALHTARAADPEHVVVVVRRGDERVAAHVTEIDQTALVAEQDDIPGTGRATQIGLGALPDGVTGTVLVTMGDIPLLAAETLIDLAAAHATYNDQRGATGHVTVLTAVLDEPRGYGRIARDDAGSVTAIVEERDASPDLRLRNEVNAGIYAFDLDALRRDLEQVSVDNAQQERYLTDVVAIARARGGQVRAVPVVDPAEIEGVNDRVQLARLGAELNRRIVTRWMRDGVTIVDPATTWIDVDVSLGRDVVIRPHTQILGATTIADDVVIGPDTTLTDVEVGAGAEVVRTQANLAVIGPGASVGPFSHLRPGTVLGAGGKIGEFVGVKNATIGDGAKVPHLSYVGDADIGPGANIGAGTIVANYDGVAKHHTSVGAHVHTGANNVLVAPVVIGDGASTGAGAVIRRDVPPGDLAVSTGPQRHIADWVRRRQPGTEAAAAADRAQAAAESDPSENTVEEGET